MSQPHVHGAHLVGSINLPDAAQVFRAVSSQLGGHVRRIPDGEVGERYYWIQFQSARMEQADGLTRLPIEPIYIRGQFDARPLMLVEGYDAEQLAFPSLGYAEAARESYGVFRALRDAGEIAAGTRFQVSLPTPAGVVGSFVLPKDQAAVEAPYERALFAELEQILASIPHEDLAIQWDTALEFALIEQVSIRDRTLTAWWENVIEGVVERAVRQAGQVPAGVEVGYHLCYGDVEEAHFVQPKDAGNLAAVLRGILTSATRPINWVHLPVPIERDDAAYFAPLIGLQVPVETEIFLGLLHHEDGVDGAARRIAAASEALSEFGVATECGFGRGPAERTAELLQLHSDVLSV
ncbi:hypothetical protein [Lysinibacter cavernae]|uniref:Methionine synthase n=1 Tax=Lysinibacter cavernae TaxID=1640652 RepID=A0A7X5R3J3_9MICO|nr:hypothetical protein [Lysinibacter cavernae]NIH55008.1 hypothetical protein [Lysinibacter cavernae]